MTKEDPTLANLPAVEIPEEDRNPDHDPDMYSLPGSHGFFQSMFRKEGEILRLVVDLDTHTIWISPNEHSSIREQRGIQGRSLSGTIRVPFKGQLIMFVDYTGKDPIKDHPKIQELVHTKLEEKYEEVME